jgi:methionine sulfoxide reductase heme-binding subunit
MNWLKKHWGWILVCILASLPLVNLLEMLSFNFEDNTYAFLLFDDYEYPPHIADQMDFDSMPGIKYASQVTGEWAIRFLLAILMCTPLRILFGWTCSLYTRQAIGITTGVYALLHFLLFVTYEGVLATFSEPELIIGFLACIIVFFLMITSNKRSMKWLKKTWKKSASIILFCRNISTYTCHINEGRLGFVCKYFRRRFFIALQADS